MSDLSQHADQILRMYKRGISSAAISDATGVPKVSVVAVLCRAGLWTTSELEKAGPAVREAVLADYRAFVPLALTMKNTGVTKEEYWVILNASGEPVRKSGGAEYKLARERRNQEIETMYLGGSSRREIADMCGVCESTVYVILKRRGVYVGFGRRGFYSWSV